MARPKGKPDPFPTRSVSEELWAAVETEGVTDGELATRTGLDRTVIRRFRTRERSITLESVDRLAHALGLRLVRTRLPRKGKAPEGA